MSPNHNLVTKFLYSKRLRRCSLDRQLIDKERCAVQNKAFPLVIGLGSLFSEVLSGSE